MEEAEPAIAPGLETLPAVEESPLVGEPLLCRPLMPERAETSFTGRSLSDLIGNIVRRATDPLPVPPPYTEFPLSPLSVVPAPGLPTPPSVMPFWETVMRPSPPLLAEFVSDNNIPVGQIFPPGAEFVKSWRMRNVGTIDWPEDTELLYVAGDRMAPFGGALDKVKVGAVKAGEETELVSGEMKVCDILTI